MTLPTGTVTFLFTDIEGSTKLAQQHPDAMPALLARHHEILQRAIQAQNGYVFQIIGDAFCAAFFSAADGVKAALEAQRCLYNEEWSPAPVKVRMGIHTGTAQLQEDGQYTGYATLASTQRIMSSGHGGQILLSGITRELVWDMLAPDTKLMDMGEKRLKDLQRPEHLYQLSVSGLPVNFPPLKTLDSFPNNLPMQLTTFIGREQEITEVKKELQSHRLVTLTGSGGAGKTRLSLQVGAACLEQFKNGVWFVELASLTDPSLIISAVRSALGVYEKGNDLHSLANHIGSQSLLLILDNCEHLIENCASVVENLIKLCPRLHVLASSREPLGIAGEQPYHVPSLPFPDPKHLPTLDEVAKCESVQLFSERVRTYVPSFSLNGKNVHSIAQICCRLDGIPLALELAAARVKVMSVEQMASRLGDMFNLLTSGNRTSLPRHQTLRALIEWSYDLLTEAEKSLFRRLAVFSGGWSLEAAEAVCSVDGGESVLENLARLVDKSLINKEELDSEARFHMLETIRQYAEFKMFASEQVEEVKNRHRDWFMQLAETAEPKLRTGEQLVWLSRLEMEHDNLRAAIKWSIEQKHVEHALRIPSALAYFWEIHGYYEEGRNWFDQALALESLHAEKKYSYPWATAVSGLANLSMGLPDADKNKPRMEQALDIFRERGDSFKTGLLLTCLAHIPCYAGDMKTAKSLYEEALNVYQTINDLWGVGRCLTFLGCTIEQDVHIQEANALYRKSAELLKLAGDRYSLFDVAGVTTIIAIEKGELNTAKDMLEESIRTFGQLKNPDQAATSTNRLTQVFHMQGEYERARKLSQRNLELQKETNNLRQIGWIAYLRGQIELAEGNLSSARQFLNEGLAIAEKMNEQFDMGHLQATLGLLDCYEGNFARGKGAIEAGIEKVRKNFLRAFSPLSTYRGHALWLERDLPEATRSYRDTIQVLRNKCIYILIPECLEGLGKVTVLQSDFARAARLFGAAETMREKMGTPIPPIQREEHENSVSKLRASMEDVGLKRIWDEGRAKTMEQAIAYVLELPTDR